METLTFISDDGTSVNFDIYGQVKLSGVNYLLVGNPGDDEAEKIVMIMKEVSAQDAEESDYEIVTDYDEIDAVVPLFEELLDDFSIEIF